MKRGVFAPVVVVAFAVMAGGWLLQEGVDRAENIYVRVRVLQEVVDHVETSFVDDVDAAGLYNSAIGGLIFATALVQTLNVLSIGFQRSLGAYLLGLILLLGLASMHFVALLAAVHASMSNPNE